MNSPTKAVNKFQILLAQLGQDFPDINFEPHTEFRWSDEQRTIYYDESAEDASWSLLHELGHMINEHKSYNSDFMLVRMEMEAWEKAKQLAPQYGHKLDEDYIQDCLDSYRTWQNQRSACPTCQQTGIEKQNGQYYCINCRSTWKVTTNRFCRVYRQKQSSPHRLHATKKPSPV